MDGLNGVKRKEVRAWIVSRRRGGAAECCQFRNRGARIEYVILGIEARILQYMLSTQQILEST